MKKFFGLSLAVALVLTPLFAWGISVPWERPEVNRIHPLYDGDAVGVGTTTERFLSQLSATASSTDTQTVFSLFDQSNSELFRVERTGNVGIGETSPLSPLHITKDQAARTALRLDNSNASGSLALDLYDGSSQRAEMLYDTASALLNIGTHINTGQLSFTTGNNVEAARFDENGQFGIGESAPTAGLHVGLRDSHSGDLFKVSSSTTDHFVIDTNGQVGINTTNPATKLDTLGTASSTNLFVADTATTTNLVLGSQLFSSLTGTGLALSGTSLTVDESFSPTWTGAHDFGGATSVELPNNGTVNANGEITTDDTSGQLRYFAGSAERVLTPQYAFSSSFASTTQGSATTTLRIAVAPYALTVDQAQCDFSNFMGISLFDGTNRADYFEASSTIGTVTFTANNTFTGGEAIRVDVGTSTNIAADVRGSCTFYFTPDAD